MLLTDTILQLISIDCRCYSYVSYCYRYSLKLSYLSNHFPESFKCRFIVSSSIHPSVIAILTHWKLTGRVIEFLSDSVVRYGNSIRKWWAYFRISQVRQRCKDSERSPKERRRWTRGKMNISTIISASTCWPKSSPVLLLCISSILCLKLLLCL